MNIVMIAVHKNYNNEVIGFRVIDTDTGVIKDVPYDNMYNILNNNTVEVENIEIAAGKIVGSNGSLQRYPLIINGMLIKRSPLIILYELPNNKYRVTNYIGEIVVISEEEVVKYSQTEGIANGKVVQDKDGECYISSINGVYKQDKLMLDMQYGSKLAAKRKMLRVNDYNIDDKYYAYKSEQCDKEVITLGRGILGIRDKGFADCCHKRIILPNTLNKLGIGCFSDSLNLETIKIPEGTTEIPERAFANDKNLESICLPNSMRVVKRAAFKGCDKLKYIYCGPIKIEYAYGSIPNRIIKLKNTEYKINEEDK